MLAEYQKSFECHVRSSFIERGKIPDFSKAGGRYKDKEIAEHFATWMLAYSVAKEESSRRIDAVLFP